GQSALCSLSLVPVARRRLANANLQAPDHDSSLKPTLHVPRMSNGNAIQTLQLDLFLGQISWLVHWGHGLVRGEEARPANMIELLALRSRCQDVSDGPLPWNDDHHINRLGRCRPSTVYE